METRKVQLSGGSTYTVSLPKTWAQEHGVDTGSVLFLHPQSDGSLHVTVPQDDSSEEQTKTVDVTNRTPSEVRDRLLALYTLGYEVVTLSDANGVDDEVQARSKETAADLTGLELVERNEKTITYESLLGPENLDVRKSALRLRLVTVSMHQDATTALFDRKPELARRVVDRDDEADKLFALLTRCFRRAVGDLQEVDRLGYDRQSLFEYYYVGRQLERVADHAERMANLSLADGADLPDQFRDDLVDLAGRAQQHVEKASEVLLGSADVSAADEVLGRQEPLRADIADLERSLYDHHGAAEAHLVGRILTSVRRTGEHGGNIAQMMIQRAARQ